MKTVVKLLVLAVIFGTTVASLTAQVPVKQDLIKMLEAVPAPPASSKDAFAKVAVADAEGNFTCSAAKLFAVTDQQLKDFENTYTEQAKAAMGANPNGVPAGMPGAGMTEADAKRIQSMTKEQKIAMAMAMAGTMNQPVQMEPPGNKGRPGSLDGGLRPDPGGISARGGHAAGGSKAAKGVRTGP